MSCRSKFFHPCFCKDSYHLALAVTFLPLWLSAGWQVSRSCGQSCMQLSACQTVAFCGSILPQTGLFLSLQGKHQQNEGTHRNVLWPFFFWLCHSPISISWKGISFSTFLGLPCAWPEEEYWVFLENFLRATTLSYLPLCTADFPSNAACSSQIIFPKYFQQFSTFLFQKILLENMKISDFYFA